MVYPNSNKVPNNINKSLDKIHDSSENINELYNTSINNMTNINSSNVNEKDIIGLADIDTFDKKTLFIYVAIIVIICAIFIRINIQLNLVFGIFIALCIIFYYYDIKKTKTKIKKRYDTEIENHIFPKPLLATKYEDISYFLFSIQEFRAYNQLSYKDMLDAIDDFVRLYDDAKKLPELVGINYGIAENKKLYAMNSLQSIIYNSPANKNVTEKLDKALSVLNDILDKYLSELAELNEKRIMAYGYDSNTIIIRKNDPKPKAFYDNDMYQTFSFY
jgi:hypothetical protein